MANVLNTDKQIAVIGAVAEGSSIRSIGRITPRQKKPKKVGRPKLPKGAAKGRIVPIRFTQGDLKAIETAAKASGQSVSEWVRGTIHATLQP